MVEKLFDHGKIGVYYDQYGNPDALRKLRGPVTESEPVGIVYMNWEKNEMTLPDGTPYVPQKIEYETKAYIVGTSDHDKVMKLIQLCEDNYEFYDS